MAKLNRENRLSFIYTLGQLATDIGSEYITSGE